MNTDLVLKALHIFGALLWVGGLSFVGILGLEVAERHRIEGPKAAFLGRMGMLARVTTGMVLTWLGGLAVFVPNIAVYKTQGWMHGKLALVVVLSALSGVLSGHLRKASMGQVEFAPAKVRMLSLVSLGVAAGIVVFAVLRPF